MSIGRVVRVVVLLAVLDVAAGAALDARLVARPWAHCVALAQKPTSVGVRACGAAVASLWTTDLPAASLAVVREAQTIWANAKNGRNTI